ncbi:hypothetical protein ASPSYDRAFT_60884 [Aspergillus sydowii CBS 593.65]|uniref:Thiamine pyrophosphokinase n=1 Tax=Aspergillus sydowii CBS 593.65 TaxID=1036612 RepID=A0A1L9T707_9EURO|nr:uncharacterized protein ASPSYDRAFT_60884 [Aspergillus sydowii CBS 593.65]OJJ55151.1 hypothetical protein ASPSYDRAFT_60884 [Aspergillus sydowii CBS 593.65]
MEWDPTQFFREDESIQPHPFVLLVLNHPINETALAILRKRALATVCADGGANWFFESAKSRGEESVDLPSTIIGDLDSIRPEVRTHYANLGVNIIEIDDMYSTDFTKSMSHIRQNEKDILSRYVRQNGDSDESLRLSVLVLGGLGGRVDQAFSQIHHLYETQGSSDRKIYLISEESITFVLQPGKNIIHVPRTNRSQPNQSSLPSSEMRSRDSKEADFLLEENVGIIPILGPARITISGFEWDVEDWKTEIGGQLSTSNHIRAETVQVQTGVPILFTLELARRLKRGIGSRS